MSQAIKDALSMEEWEEKYKPIVNHINPDASFQNEYGVGIMFETYDAELDFVQSKAGENKVWTYIDTDDGGACIVAGMALVNRIGYFVTDVAWENLDIFVDVIEGD